MTTTIEPNRHATIGPRVSRAQAGRWASHYMRQLMTENTIMRLERRGTLPADRVYGVYGLTLLCCAMHLRSQGVTLEGISRLLSGASALRGLIETEPGPWHLLAGPGGLSFIEADEDHTQAIARHGAAGCAFLMPGSTWATDARISAREFY